ncbi:unnamed protein product [Moneuplotes crassus]|uniref:Uncharacterized protein n=1 Tax=Euplotes crassus TaxID=5936 RepID=A0AAD1Y6G1_EUPCR|nr:unnamed protein product [Moneuplotes crassus]
MEILDKEPLNVGLYLLENYEKIDNRELRLQKQTRIAKIIQNRKGQIDYLESKARALQQKNTEMETTKNSMMNLPDFVERKLTGLQFGIRKMLLKKKKKILQGELENSKKSDQ